MTFGDLQRENAFGVVDCNNQTTQIMKYPNNRESFSIEPILGIVGRLSDV